ncbi:MAG: ATP-binding protein [Actinomycetota bacterium]|nr:ATP-binding protein [Actinomycetota bacterium]
MSRVPIRLRLTAAFALAMAVVFAVAGLLLYQHLQSSLDRTLDQSLRARATDVAALVSQADHGLSESRVLANEGRGFAQILDMQGRVFDQTPGLRRSPLFSPQVLARARQSSVYVQRAPLDGESVRLFANPVNAQGRRLIVVVGSSLETRDGALLTLRHELLVGGPAALLLASLLGYLVAGAALRPVERMRARAAEISASSLDERLPVVRSRDEVSRLGETLNAMLARLETSLERERSFVADASHELRTPLAHLQAEVELALERPRDRAELESALRAVAVETDRLSQLAADLLLLARADEGGLPLRLDQLVAREVMEGVATRYARRAADAGRAIEVGGDVTVHVDRLRIEQALGNLIDNALRHGAGTIFVSARAEDDSAVFEVRDEGGGFPARLGERAFERFSRAEESRTSPGSGLGLAIVAAVTEAHGGTATIGHGAAVSICIPGRRET